MYFGIFKAFFQTKIDFFFQLEMAPPLRDEIIVDRATQNSARNRFDILNKESDELDAQSRQLGEAYETMIRIQTRYCIQSIFLKFHDFLR